MGASLMWMNWLSMARESVAAAGACQRRGCARSALSRSYYAAFAGATAYLLQSGESPRSDLGTWSHDSLGVTLESVMRRNRRDRQAPEAAAMVRRLYAMRVEADYSPAATIGPGSAVAAIRWVRSFLLSVWPREQWP
ncbi:MAG: HEPN domain-containing protein [Phycisphaerales bacterium]|nr:HEPN domain-containing protein [Phycisphaerales bacterium]